MWKALQKTEISQENLRIEHSVSASFFKIKIFLFPFLMQN